MLVAIRGFWGGLMNLITVFVGSLFGTELQIYWLLCNSLNAVCTLDGWIKDQL